MGHVSVLGDAHAGEKVSSILAYIEQVEVIEWQSVYNQSIFTITGLWLCYGPPLGSSIRLF